MSDPNQALTRSVELVPVAPAIEGPGKLALVKGYLSMSFSEEEDNAEWLLNLRRAGWKGAVYHLRWESGKTRELIQNLGLSLLLRMGLKLAARRVLLPLPPLGIYELGEIRRHWSAARHRAATVDAAAMIELLRHESDSSHWTLVGHSLGTRIVTNLLQRCGHHERPIGDAVLLGGTLPRNGAEWAGYARGVQGQLLNVYHPGDRVLDWLYRVSELNRVNPCGVRPIEEEHPKIRNVAVGGLLPKSFRSHMRYHETLHETVGPHLWAEPATLQLPAPHPIETKEETR